MSQPDLSTLSWAAGQSAAATGATGSGVRSAIARAAGATGVDFSYLVAQARLESSMNPGARAATSSASGLYQFTNSTWLQTLQKHGDLLGQGLGQNLDGASSAQLLALRSDPAASAMMAASLASDNAGALTATLGRTPDASELYLAHFLGSDGAGKFLTALAVNPDQSAAALLPKAAAANRAIFFGSDGSARSLAQVMSLIRDRMDSAMQAEGTGADSDIALMAAGAASAGAAPTAPPPTGGPIAQEWASAQAEMGQAPTATSMADTLQATFGGADSSSTPAFVRSAYGAFKAMGM